MSKTKEMPLPLALKAAQSEIANVINSQITDKKLPCYSLKPIVLELLHQLEEGERMEIEMAEKAMKESEAKKEDGKVQ